MCMVNYVIIFDWGCLEIIETSHYAMVFENLLYNPLNSCVTMQYVYARMQSMYIEHLCDKVASYFVANALKDNCHSEISVTA